MEDLMESELVALLEPDLRVDVRTPDRREFRRSGAQRVSIMKPPATHSFKVFAREALSRLYTSGAIREEPPTDDQAFHAYLAESFPSWRAQGNRNAIYYGAVGLFAFGHKEHLLTVISHAPSGEEAYWDRPLWACKYLRILLPPFWLPYCPFEQSEQALEWLQKNLDEITWLPEEQLCFHRVAAS